MLVAVVLYAITPAWAQIDTEKWYRVKHVESGKYFTALNHDQHIGGAAGGIAVTEKERNLEQVFKLISVDGNYKLQGINGYNVYLQGWNVDAIDGEGSVIQFAEVEDGVFHLKKNADQYFKVDNVSGWGIPADGDYVFCDAPLSDAATFSLEEVNNDNFIVGNEVYYFDPVKDEAYLSYFVTDPVGAYTVPSRVQVGIKNYTITEVANQAFMMAPGVTHVTIPSTVRSIQEQAFWNCTVLQEVVLPESLERIDHWAFRGCTSLQSVTLPESLVSLGRGVFWGSGLQSMIIPASVNFIDQAAFANCDDLHFLSVSPNNPVYHTDGGEYDFQNNIIETATNTLIAASANGPIPRSVTTIGKNVFQGQDELFEKEIPASVTTIQHWAFGECPKLTRLYVYGETAPVLEESFPFESCPNLTTVYVRPGTAGSYISGGWEKFTIEEMPEYYEVNGVWYRLNFDDQTAEVVNCQSGSYSGDINIWSSFNSTLVGSFKVTSIANNAFYGAELSSLIIQDGSIKTIGNHAFWGVTGVGEVVIPESVEHIGHGAFGRGGYESITIPTNVSFIGNAAFTGNKKLHTLNVHVDNPYFCSEGSTLYSKDKTWLCSVSAATNGEFVIPATVDSVRNFCFEHCDSITKIVVPEGVVWAEDEQGKQHFIGCNPAFEVTANMINYELSSIYSSVAKIVAPRNATGNYEGSLGVPQFMPFYGDYYQVTEVGEGALQNDYLLTEFFLPSGITTIGANAFHSSGIKQIDLPVALQTIGNSAFSNCDSLTSFTLPNNVTSIGDHVCYGCDNLETVNLNDVLTEISWNAFRICPNLTSVSWGNSIETIGFTAFHSTGLTHIDFPASLTTIEDGAFGKSQLQSVEIPASITYIGQAAFSGISTLTSITVDVENPNYAAQNGVLYSKDMETLLCVPASLEGTFVVPAFVRSIMGYSFEACTGLTSLSMSTATPPTIFEYAFWECENLTTIYVSRGATEAYQIEPLEDFNIIEMATPESGKYYLLKSRATGNRVAIENAEGQVVLQENWITPETWTLADHGRAIWKVQGEGNEVEFQNFHSLEWLKTAGPLYQAYSTVKNNQSTYTVAHQDGNFFTLFDEELATTSAYMHADITYNKVVRWDGANNINNAWEFVEVPADVVEELLAQKERNRTLEAKKYALTRHDFFGDSETFTDHGLIRNASFISTNKQEPTEGPIEHLLDGDVSTFFHSSWSTANTDDEFHYLQVDLGEAVDHLAFRFARRIGTTHNDAPKSIRVYGTNDLTSDTWNEWFTFDLVYQTSAFGYDELIADHGISSAEAYRYVRIVVEGTNDGRTTNGNLFFSLSEFGIWDNSRNYEFFFSLTADEQDEIRDAIADAKAELAAEAATQETINRLNAALKLISEIEVLTDGENFTNAVEKEASRITYSRNFKNTNWQPWYVPFEMEYDAISDNFDVARLNDVHQFDDNNDGEFERWALEIERLKSGDVIQANLPYMVRAKATGETKFYVDDATLYPSESNSIDCSSTRVLYTFTGIYAPISGVDLRENGCYIMSSGKLLTPTVSTTLKPYRWYLQPEARAGYATFYAPKQILVFEKDEFGTTGIEGAVMDDESAISWPADVYDLNGRLVMKQATSLDALPKGVYMIGGVKIIK